MLTKVALGVVVGALAIQLVPIDRSNSPHESEIPAPAEVRAILERSCYDCHSTQTRWPWYSYVAPISWLMAYDIHEAREHLAMSNWGSYDAEEKAHKLEEVWEEVEEGEMPLWIYLPLHPEAELSNADKEALRVWATAGAS
jgi:hypothetical protein